MKVLQQLCFTRYILAEYVTTQCWLRVNIVWIYDAQKPCTNAVFSWVKKSRFSCHSTWTYHSRWPKTHAKSTMFGVTIYFGRATDLWSLVPNLRHSKFALVRMVVFYSHLLRDKIGWRENTPLIKTSILVPKCRGYHATFIFFQASENEYISSFDPFQSKEVFWGLFYFFNAKQCFISAI